MRAALLAIFLPLAVLAQDVTWPPPEAWCTLETAGIVQASYCGNASPEAVKLLAKKDATYHLESALGPQFSTPPSWFTAQYKSAPSDAADLKVFLRSEVGNLSRVDLTYLGPHTTIESATVYQLAIVDHGGRIVLAVASLSIEKAWQAVNAEAQRQIKKASK